MTTPHILVLGDINADLAAALASFPHEGDDSAINALRWCSGGAGVNTATALALLGSNVTLIGRVGNDPAAAVALRAATAAGVQLHLVQRDAVHATGLCIAAVSPGGQRTFLSFRGANVAFDAAAITPDVLDGAQLLHICGHALLDNPQRASALRVAQMMLAQGVRLSLDLCTPAARHCHDLIMELLPNLSLLFMNEDELDLFLPYMDKDTALEYLVTYGVNVVALKCGQGGCLLRTRHQQLALAALAVDAIDTNGCGDAFAAGFIKTYLAGASLLGCAAVGNLLGGITATTPGAADALPNLDALITHLTAHNTWVGVEEAAKVLNFEC